MNEAKETLAVAQEDGTSRNVAPLDANEDGHDHHAPPGHFDLGIVFVHGMGETKPGDTLIRFLNPTVEWIKRWANWDYTVAGLADGASTLTNSVLPIELPNPPNSALPTIDRVDHTLLRSADATERNFTPPHSIITLSKGNDSKSPARWLAVEAWWAEEFTPPKFGDVASWALGLTPYIIVRHFKAPPASTPQWWFLIQPLRYLIALLFVPIFELAMMLLLLAGAIPFIQKYAKGIILNLIGSFGDVLMYTADAVRATAIRGAVERSIKWSETNNQCKKLVIVGYSLGSLISYDILNRQDLGASSFVTFGMPIKKAGIALQLQRYHQRTSLGIVTAAASLLLAIAAAIIVFWNDLDWADTFTSRWGLGLFSVCMVACASVILRRFSNTTLFSILTVLFCGTAILIVLWQDPRAESMAATWRLFLAAALFALAAVLIYLRFRWKESDIGAWPTWRVWLFREPPFVVSASLIVVAFSLWFIDVGTEITYVAPLALAAIALAWSAIDLPQDGVDVDEPYKLKIAGLPAGETMPWLDFWATADPFPEYGVADVPRPTAGRPFEIESRKITNRRSVIWDHSIYGENPEQFVAPFADHLLKQTGPAWTMFPAGSADATLLASYQDRRRRRVTCLGISFWTTFLVPLLLSDDWYLRFFEPLLLEQNGTKLKFVPEAWEFLNRTPSETATVLGIALILGATLLWYKLVDYSAWRSWDRAVERDLFERRLRWSANRILRLIAFFAVGYLAPVAVAAVAVWVWKISWVA